MLHRQKVIMRLLQHFDDLQKLDDLQHICYLMRYQSTTAGGGAFYDFVPRRGEPHSFALEHELGKLVSAGLIGMDGDPPRWTNRFPPPVIEASVESDIPRLGSDRSTTSPDTSRRDASASSAVYTAGYEGLSIDRFLRLLVDSGIQRLIDVRNNPSSRRYGFHKTTLRRLTSELAIAYEHIPELGIAASIRDQYSNENSRPLMFDRYEATTLKAESEVIERVADLIRERPSVLVCMEADPADCHRSRLAKSIARLTGLAIVHLHVE